MITRYTTDGVLETLYNTNYLTLDVGGIPGNTAFGSARVWAANAAQAYRITHDWLYRQNGKAPASLQVQELNVKIDWNAETVTVY